MVLSSYSVCPSLPAVRTELGGIDEDRGGGGGGGGGEEPPRSLDLLANRAGVDGSSDPSSRRGGGSKASLSSSSSSSSSSKAEGGAGQSRPPTSLDLANRLGTFAYFIPRKDSTTTASSAAAAPSQLSLKRGSESDPTYTPREVTTDTSAALTTSYRAIRRSKNMARRDASGRNLIVGMMMMMMMDVLR